MPDKEIRTSPLTVLGDGLLLLCAMLGMALSFLTLYGDGALANAYQGTALDRCAAHTDSFLGLAVFFALAALCIWSLPRFRWAAAGGAALLWGFALSSHWEAVFQGGAVVVRTISLLFAQRVSWGLVLLYDPGLPPAEAGAAARLFLTLALAGLALALGWAVVRARRWWIAALLTLPPLLPGLLADLYPSWPAFLALCACWCTMLLCDLCKWAAPDRRGKLTLAVLPCAAVVLAVITLAFPQEGYSRPAWALDRQNELYRAADRIAGFFSQFDGPFQRTVTYVGAAEEADLSQAGPLNYTGRTVLRVKSDYDGRLYLRGASLAVYEDGVWKALPEGTYEEYAPFDSYAPIPLYFPALQAQDGPTCTITVDNVGAVGSCVYVPYFPIPQDQDDAGMLPVEDAYFARRQGQWTHTMEFVELPKPYPTYAEDGTVMLPTGTVILPTGTVMLPTGQAGGTSFESYSSFVSRHYLDVPEELWESLAGPYWTRYHFVTADRLWAAENVAALLDELCEYDPETPAAPEGVDPVLYFLNESHRGYCMHYASAAALMLRALGVPARYVSGFTVESAPDTQAAVPDRAAHAWVEIWIDGFGWYPVEVTPAAAFQWYEQGIVDPEDLPSEPAEESEEPEPAPTPEPSLAPDAAELPSALPDEVDAAERGLGLDSLIPAAKAAAAVLGVLALLWLGQRLPKRYRAKRLSGPDRDRAALYGYNCLLRMARWGGRMDERALELAQKAKFSQHGLSQEELDELLALVDRERDRLCVVLDPLPRLAFRYAWGMPRRPEPPGPPERPG